MLFQPHRYSRAPLFTQVLHDEFGAAFDKADSVTFMDVYPAGEAPVPGVSGKTFLNVVLEHEGHPRPISWPIASTSSRISWTSSSRAIWSSPWAPAT